MSEPHNQDMVAHGAKDDITLDDKRKVRLCAILSMVVALALIAMKAVAWVLSGSVALLGALLDSVLDFSISLMNYFAIRHAQAPADREHRFGHGKAEALAALAQGVLIAAAALFLVKESVLSFIAPVSVLHADIGMAVMLVSIVLTLFLVYVQRRVAKSTKSIAISADSAHYASDVWMNIGVIVALVLSAESVGLIYADAICGMVVAIILGKGAWEIICGAVEQLMDHEMDNEARRQIKEIINAHPQVRGVHDLRTRRAGLDCFIQCHIELDGKLSLIQAHDISDEVEESLMRAFPNAEVLIHQDPAGHEHPTPLEKS